MSAPPIRIESKAWTDTRYVTLALELGLSASEADTALIRVAAIWRWQTEHYTDEAPTYAVDAAVVKGALRSLDGARALVAADLAELEPDGRLRVRGGRDDKGRSRIDWLYRERERNREKGERRAQKAKDEGGRAAGRFITSRAPAAHQPEGVCEPAGNQPATSSPDSGLRTPEESLSLGGRAGARDPGAPAPVPEPVPLAVGTVREAPAVDASPTVFDRELGELVDLAVATLDRARAELDPKARAIGLHGDQPGRLKLRDRLRAAGDARRADLEHCLAVLIAECRATGEVGNLRLGMLAGEASWERLRLATVASARGRDGPAARASPRADRGQAPVSKTAQRFDGDVPL